MNAIVFFVFDPSPRIERRIEAFIDAGFDVKVYGYRYEVINVNYCNSPKYIYNVIDTVPQGVSYGRRFSGLKKVKSVISQFDNKNTLFYFFSLNVAAIAPFLPIKYVYEESDMLFDRFHNPIIRRLVIAFNKYVIKKSSITVMTSEGFSDFYFGEERKNNIEFVPNKVNSKCLQLPVEGIQPFDVHHIRFGFAGNIRYKATLNLAKIIAKNYPQHEFHFWGNTESLKNEDLNGLKVYRNIIMHGLFKNPDDLPAIYSSMDFCVCNYDIDGLNPRYAEPNKLYEAIFFDTPILVSPQTFLGKKVKQLRIGFEIDSYDENLIKETVDSINKTMYDELVHNIHAIPKEKVVADNMALIDRIRAIE